MPRYTIVHYNYTCMHIYIYVPAPGCIHDLYMIIIVFKLFALLIMFVCCAHNCLFALLIIVCLLCSSCVATYHSR